MNVSRRSFMTLTAICAGAASLGIAGCGGGLEKEPQSDDAKPSYRPVEPEVTKVRTACGNCHNNCGMIANVQDGVIRSLEGDPEHPHGKGSLCPKGQAFVDVVYSPDRLKYPMRRTGERGTDTWERISWDEALETIATRLAEIKEEFGPQFLTTSNGAPVQNIVRNAFFELFARYGTPNQASVPNTCFVPRLIALNTTYGFRCEEDLNNAELIINWGANPFASMRPSSFMCYEKEGCVSSLLDAQERGAKIVVIDPVCSETAAKADQWISVRPGTDGALALAMNHVIITEDLYDHEFVEKWCQGFDKLVPFIQEYTPEWAEGVTGVSASEITELARLYASTPKASIHDGNNFSAHTNAVQAVRAIAILRAITGHLDVEGGNCCFPDVIGNPVKTELGNSAGIPPTVKVETPPLAASYYPMLASGMPATLKALETGEPYKPKAMMMYHTNGAMAQGDFDRTVRLLNEIEFIVVNDLFMTETARQLADIVIPDACFLERYDYRTYPSAQGTVVTLRPPAVEPPAEVLTAYEVELELANRLGLAEDYPWTTQEEFIDYALSPSGLTLSDLEKEPTQIVGTHTYKKYETGGLRPDGEPGFNTPTGKVLLYNIPFEKNGYDPLPTYVEPSGSVVAHPELAADYPLVGINRRTVYYVHFKYRNNPYLRELHPDPEVNINPIDADARSLENGDWATLSSPTGSSKFVVKRSERVKPGTVWVDGGFGQSWDYPESNMNRLMSGSDLDPISQSPALDSFLVQVEKA